MEDSNEDVKEIAAIIIFSILALFLFLLFTVVLFQSAHPLVRLVVFCFSMGGIIYFNEYTEKEFQIILELWTLYFEILIVVRLSWFYLISTNLLIGMLIVLVLFFVFLYINIKFDILFEDVGKFSSKNYIFFYGDEYQEVIVDAKKYLLSRYKYGIKSILANRLAKSQIASYVNDFINNKNVHIGDQATLIKLAIEIIKKLDEEYESRDWVNSIKKPKAKQVGKKLTYTQPKQNSVANKKSNTSVVDTSQKVKQKYQPPAKTATRVARIYRQVGQKAKSNVVYQPNEIDIQPSESVSPYSKLEYTYGRYNLYRNTVKEFLDFVINQHSLKIKDYFQQMKPMESFFLVAATGLGKTVATPIFLLHQRMEIINLNSEFSPKVWVVVPKIPIAISEAQHLNELFHEYLETSNNSSNKALTNLFGYRTSVETKNPNAPIQFITTGVLPLLANSGELSPVFDRVVIDEAHQTLEADESVELSLIKLWSQGIVVDYMSATVETTNLAQKLNTSIVLADKSRFVNFYHNTKKTLLESITDIIENTLGRYNPDSRYFPSQNVMSCEKVSQIHEGTNAIDRASGMLIVVNSFAGKNSDVNNVQKTINSICGRYGIKILKFAGAIQRNPKLYKKFKSDMEKIESNCDKYVIISTNIVEMGITWPSLDYVVTMDSEMQTIMVNGVKFPTLVPLGVNALKQRGGRVGRKRAGCVYITKEYGTDYTQIDDYNLNNGGLDPQDIRFPLEFMEPYKLAFNLCIQQISGIDQIIKFLENSGLPSLYNNEDLEYIAIMTNDLINKFKSLGVDQPKNADALRFTQRWVGDPVFPFVFEAFKYIIDNGYPGFRVFFSLIYLGGILNYSVEDLYINCNTIETVDSNGRLLADNGKRFDDSNILMSYRTNNSDLLRLGYELGVGDGTFSQEDIDHFKYGGKAWLDGTIEQIEANEKMKGATNLKFAEGVTRLFLDVLKVIQKTDFESYMESIDKPLPEVKPWIEQGWNKFEHDESLDVGGYISRMMYPVYPNQDIAEHVHKKLEHSHINIYQILLRIYECIGFKFTLQSTPNKGEYIYTGELNDNTYQGIINQKNHFCQLNTTSEFYGILRPQSDRQTNETVFDLIHILRIGTDYHGG